MTLNVNVTLLITDGDKLLQLLVGFCLGCVVKCHVNSLVILVFIMLNT